MPSNRFLIEISDPRSDGAGSRFATESIPDFDPGVLPDLPGCHWDVGYGGHAMPAGRGATDSPRAERSDVPLPAQSTWVTRAHVDDDRIDEFRAAALQDPRVASVGVDLQVDTQGVCLGSAAVGAENDVAVRLGVPAFQALGLEGQGVQIALVDTGSNQDFLHAHGKTRHSFDGAASLTLDPARIPGHVAAETHGTMTAYSSLIAAPRATLLDLIAIGLPVDGLGTFLSHIYLVFKHLTEHAERLRQAGQPFGLVCSNSWGIYDPSGDFPTGDPANYTSNPNHIINLQVASLNSLGVDMVFAAGNCGTDCPDGRCSLTGRTIYGANSHPKSLAIGAVDIHGSPAGYSANGPGFLGLQKPDLCGFAHYLGSGISPVDAGTSTAAPGVAGVIAALRSRYPYDPVSQRFAPVQIRDLLRTTATRAGSTFDNQVGWGVINPTAALTKGLP